MGDTIPAVALVWLYTHTHTLRGKWDFYKEAGGRRDGVIPREWRVRHGRTCLPSQSLCSLSSFPPSFSLVGPLSFRRLSINFSRARSMRARGRSPDPPAVMHKCMRARVPTLKTDISRALALLLLLLVYRCRRCCCCCYATRRGKVARITDSRPMVFPLR